MIIPTVNLTRQEVELRLDQIYAIFKKISVLADQEDSRDILVAEALDGKFQTIKLLEDLYKGMV